MTFSLHTRCKLIYSSNALPFFQLRRYDDGHYSTRSNSSSGNITTTTTTTTTNNNNNNTNRLGRLDIKTNIVVREATPEDYHDVISIDEGLHNGRDYLPHTYHRALGAPDSKTVVCEADGHVIGYAAAHLIDGGQTLALSSGRVKYSHRGHGYTKMMLKDIRTHFRFQNGKLKQEVLVSKVENPRLKKTFFEQYVDVLQKESVNFIVPKEKQLEQLEVQNRCENQKGNQHEVVSPLDADETAGMLSDMLTDSSALKEELFGSSDFIILNHSPFGISAQNSEDIMKSNDIVLFSGMTRDSSKTLHCFRNDLQNNVDYQGTNNYHNHCHNLLKCVSDVQSLNAIQKRHNSSFNSNRAVVQSKDIDSGLIIMKPHSLKFKARGGDVLKTNSILQTSMPPVLSVGNYHPCKLGLAYNIDLHFPDSYDYNTTLEAVCRHMDHHMMHALTRDFKETIHFIAYVPANSNYQKSLVCDVIDRRFDLKPVVCGNPDLHLYRRHIR